MNSFRFIERGIRAEIARQERLLRGGRRGRAGDAALRPAHRARSRRCAPRRRRTTTATSPSPTSCRWRSTEGCSSARGRRCPSCRPTARERFERELGLSADSARLLAFRAELGDYFEAALARRPSRRRRAAGARQLGRPSCSAPARRRGPGRLAASTPAALAQLVGAGRGQGGDAVGAAQQVLDRLVAEGGDPAAIVEAEGLGGDRRRRRARPRSSRRRSRPTPTSPRSCAAAT